MVFNLKTRAILGYIILENYKMEQNHVYTRSEQEPEYVYSKIMQ